MNILKNYNSVAELAATLDGNVINPSKDGDGWCVSLSGKTSLKHFAGVETIADARQMLVYGDAEAAAKIRAEGEIVKPKEDHKPLLRSAVVGCLPNVPNYLRGVPAQMYQVKSNSRKRPVVNVYVEATIYDGISEKSLDEKCSVLANAIAAVELTGYRVNLFAICASSGQHNTAGICVNIKEADSPLNLLNIAFPLTNKAFCRAIYLRWVDVNVKESLKRGRQCNYGCVVSSSRVKELFNTDGLFFSMHELVDNDTTQEEIEDKINRFVAE